MHKNCSEPTKYLHMPVCVCVRNMYKCVCARAHDKKFELCRQYSRMLLLATACVEWLYIYIYIYTYICKQLLNTTQKC